MKEGRRGRREDPFRWHRGAALHDGKPLRFSGEVAGKQDEGDECVLELAVRAANDLGDHATGTVVVTLPRS